MGNVEQFDVGEVSLVWFPEHPANDKESLAFKIRGEDMGDNIDLDSLNSLEPNLDDHPEIKSFLDRDDVVDSDKSLLKAGVALFQKLDEEIDEEVKDLIPFDVEQESDEEVEGDEGAKASEFDLEGFRDQIQEELNKVADEIELDVVENLKKKFREAGAELNINRNGSYDDLPEEAKRKIKTQEEEIEKLRKEREKEKMVNKVSESFQTLAKSDEEAAEVLLSLKRQASDDVYSKVFDMLKASDNRAVEAGVLDEKGMADSPSSDVENKVDDLAKELMSEDDDIETIEQARSKVYDQNPELAEKVRKNKQE